MADKSRSIQTKFWYDTWVENLNISEKLLYLYFLTNPLTNLLGVYEISLKRISDESGIKKETIRKALERFETDSRIIYTDNFIIITKFLKNQKLNPNMQLNVENLFEALPSHLKNKILDNGSKGFESIRNGLLKQKGKLKGKLKGKGKGKIETLPRKNFVKPTKAELDDYCKKMNYGVNTDRFLSHYNSNGWKVGKNPMKSWEAALKTWHLKDLESRGISTKTTRKLLGHRYKCISCNKEIKYREMKGEDDTIPYRCDENNCQKIGLGRDGKNMVGYELKYIEPIYNDES